MSFIKVFKKLYDVVGETRGEGGERRYDDLFLREGRKKGKDGTVHGASNNERSMRSHKKVTSTEPQSSRGALSED
jgi:hypothetical protein